MNQPETRFSAGFVSASIWNNKRVFDGKEVDTKSVTFQKRYKDKDGQWKTSSSLDQRDIADAMVVLGKTYEHLKLKVTTP